jgi:hypothetical protein
MARTISNDARSAAYAQFTDEAFIALVKIVESTLPDAIRAAANGEDVTSNGEVYTGMDFDVKFPEDKKDKIGQISIAIQNVDRQIVEAVRSAAGPPTVTTSLVLASSPDTIEQGPYEWKLRRAEYNVMIVSGAILADDVRHEPFPPDAFTPTVAPGLFQ